MENQKRIELTGRESDQLLIQIGEALTDLRTLRLGLNMDMPLPEEIQLTKFAKSWLGVEL